jgi:CRP/FNR family cyclic AMP-dependent transcriptional regulator
MVTEVKTHQILQGLFKSCRTKNLVKGRLVLYEGNEVENIYYIVSGYIKVYTVVNSQEQRIIYIYKAGDVFPLTTYLSGSNIARFFYECMSPVELKAMTSKRFEEKAEGNYELGEALLQYTTSIDQQFLRRVNDMISTSSALEKILSLLNFLMNKFGTGKDQMHINLPISLKDIANMCGLTREEIAKQLVYLKNSGVTYSSHSFTIDKAKLKALKQKT